MRAARTHHGSSSGRLGSLPRACRGGSGPFRGSGETVPCQRVAANLGRLGSLGRSFATLTRVRAQQGVWGPDGYGVIMTGLSYVAAKQAPQAPQPPRFTCKPLLSFSIRSGSASLSTSLSYFRILPNLPDEKKGYQPNGLKGWAPTKSSERAKA